MSVELTVPEHLVGDLMSDISGKRGGRILGLKNVQARFTSGDDDQDVDESRKGVFALIPLSEMVGYNTYLRSISKGEATFSMSFSHYERVSGMKQVEILDEF